MEENNNVTENGQQTTASGGVSLENPAQPQQGSYGQAPQPQSQQPQQGVYVQQPNPATPYQQPQNGSYSYGQPQQQGGYAPQQQNYSYGQQPQPNPAMQYQQPKKGKAGIIIGIIAALAAVLIIGIVAVAVRNLSSKNPEDMLKAGMDNISEEMKAYTTSISDKIDFKALSERISEQPSHVNLDASFSLPSEDIENVSVELDGVSDAKNKQGNCSISAGTAGFNMSIADITVDDTVIYLNIPMLSDDVYSLDFATFVEDYNNSAWRELIGEEMPEDYSEAILEGVTSGADLSELEQELIDKLSQRVSEIKETIQYAKLKEKKEFEVRGKTAQCSGITITIAKDDANAFLAGIKNDIMESDYYLETIEKSFADYVDEDADYDSYKDEIDEVTETLLGMQLDEDLVINLYFDKEGRILQIMCDRADMSGDYGYFEFTADFEGEERTLDDVSIDIIFGSDDGEELGISLTRTAEVTDENYSDNIGIDFYSDDSDDDLELNFWNDWTYSDNSFDFGITMDVGYDSFGITGNGAFTDITKGEGYMLDFDNLTVSAGGDELIMTGSLSVEPFDGDIEIPENSVKVFDMTQDDIYGLIYDALYDIGGNYYY